MYRTLFLSTICLLMFATCCFAQGAHGKHQKKEKPREVHEDLDDSSKQMLMAFSVDYDSVVFLMGTGGYGSFPVLNGFGFTKENVFQLQARGQFAKSKLTFNLHLDTILRKKITATEKISVVRIINFTQLSSLNPDSLLTSGMDGSDIPFYTIRLIQNNRYVLKGRKLLNSLTKDERIFDGAVEQLDTLLESDKP